jgi:large subunit ribosomal protein L30
MAGKQLIAAVWIRNTTEASHTIRDTLEMLRLRRKNTCVVFDKTPAITGMLQKAKDFVTYGEITEETYNTLVQKRGEKDAAGKIKPHFHMHPPRGGFERGGIKHSFQQGGALGYRGAKMDELVRKML